MMKAAFLALLLSGGVAPAQQSAAASASSCETEPLGHALDFWVGEWTVLGAGGALAGTNRIEKALQGCALTELWRDSRGGEGRSLFTFNAATRRWKQVWVTGRTDVPGGLKEKRLVARLPNGGTRFLGEVALPTGDLVLDRTTLTPNVDGTVRQVIELSRDGGSTWKASFDATYERMPAAPEK